MGGVQAADIIFFEENDEAARLISGSPSSTALRKQPSAPSLCAKRRTRRTSSGVTPEMQGAVDAVLLHFRIMNVEAGDVVMLMETELNIKGKLVRGVFVCPQGFAPHITIPTHTVLLHDIHSHHHSLSPEV